MTAGALDEAVLHQAIPTMGLKHQVTDSQSCSLGPEANMLRRSSLFFNLEIIRVKFSLL